MNLINMTYINMSTPMTLAYSGNSLFSGALIPAFLLLIWVVLAIKLNGKKSVTGVSLMLTVICILLSGLNPPLIEPSMIGIFLLLSVISFLFL